MMGGAGSMSMTLRGLKGDDKAQKDFDDLLKFNGLAADDTFGRMERLTKFIEQYKDEMVASRARVMLQDLQKRAAGGGAQKPH
jgi:hypothetical protein